jgi:hypothetical protein
MSRAEQRAIEWDCQRAWLSFYACFDNWDYDGMMTWCTPDVEWLRAGKQLQGPEQIVDELRQRPRTQTVRHSLSNILITTEPEDRARASGQCHLLAWRHMHTAPALTPPTIQHPYLFLVVTAEFYCVDDDWLIHRQAMHREFVFPDSA